MERRVFVSATADQSLDDRRRLVKSAIISKIQAAGYSPQMFWEMGRALDLGWSFENVDQIMRQCVGAIVIGFPRWAMSAPGQSVLLVGEYHHYEGAVALTLGLPTMIIAERGVENRCIVWQGGGRPITPLPADATEDWVNTPEFTTRFNSWNRALMARKDIFLGYCSKSAGTAAQVQLLLERNGATVRNWAMDFRFGASILQELEAARIECTCGIFLFTEDDPLEGNPEGAAPRDNVVLEAGYFISAKGPSRCLVIREGRAKMPADLGGAIYVQLNKEVGVSSIESKLIQFLETAL